MNARIMWKVSQDENNANYYEATVLDNSGNKLTLRTDRGFIATVIKDATGTDIAEVTGNGSREAVTQALKNYLITDLDCSFSGDNTPRITSNLVVTAIP